MSEPAPIPLFSVHMPDSAAEAVGKVLSSGRVADGEQVKELERLLGGWVGTTTLLTVSDISAAIQLALYLAGVRPGDEVIVPAMVCTASTMPIANLWARPAWADVDPRTGMLDPADIARRVTPRTRAVLYYHWAGDVAECEAIEAEAARLDLPTVEDASDAFGAEVGGKRLGNGTADFTVYSFRATKHLTSGEGGALICRRPDDLERARKLRRYGIHQPSFRLPNGDLNPASDIPEAGWNVPLTNFAAAIGVQQFPHLKRIVSRARENGAFYDAELRGIPGLTLSPRRPDAISAYWTYSLLAECRGELVDALVREGIGSQRLHVRNDTYSCFRESVRPPLPGTDHFDGRNLSIPSGWWVGPAERERVARRLRAGW